MLFVQCLCTFFFIVVHRSKRAQPTSHLESLGLLIAPSVGDLSRVWRVICCVALQMWGGFVSCLEGWRRRSAVQSSIDTGALC